MHLTYVFSYADTLSWFKDHLNWAKSDTWYPVCVLMEIFLLHIKTQNNTIAALGLKKGPGCLQGPSVCSLQFPPGAPGLPASKNMQG